MRIRVYTKALSKYAMETRSPANVKSGFVITRPFYEGYRVENTEFPEYLWMQCSEPNRLIAIPRERILHVEPYVTIDPKTGKAVEK